MVSIDLVCIIRFVLALIDFSLAIPFAIQTNVCLCVCPTGDGDGGGDCITKMSSLRSELEFISIESIIFNSKLQTGGTLWERF